MPSTAAVPSRRLMLHMTLHEDGEPPAREEEPPPPPREEEPEPPLPLAPSSRHQIQVAAEEEEEPEPPEEWGGSTGRSRGPSSSCPTSVSGSEHGSNSRNPWLEEEVRRSCGATPEP